MTTPSPSQKTNHQPPSPSRRHFLKMAGTASATALALGTLSQMPLIADACRVSQKVPNTTPQSLIPSTKETLIAKDFSHVPERNSKLSKKQLIEHIGLYEGYVKKLNQAQNKLNEANATGNFENIRTLQLKRSYSHDGAILHDYYFSNLGEDQPLIGKQTGTLLERDFGSVENYLNNLTAVGSKMRGWVITGFSHLDNKVYNYGLDAHDAGMPSHVSPLVVMDVYEHAYMIDFGTKRSEYLDVFKHSIRWEEVEKRLHQALQLASQ